MLPLTCSAHLRADGARPSLQVNILNLGLSSFSLRKILGQSLPPDSFSYFPHLHTETLSDMSSGSDDDTAGKTAPQAQEWGDLNVESSRGRDYRGRVDMLWFMIITVARTVPLIMITPESQTDT